MLLHEGTPAQAEEILVQAEVWIPDGKLLQEEALVPAEVWVREEVQVLAGTRLPEEIQVLAGIQLPEEIWVFFQQLAVTLIAPLQKLKIRFVKNLDHQGQDILPEMPFVEQLGKCGI